MLTIKHFLFSWQLTSTIYSPPVHKEIFHPFLYRTLTPESWGACPVQIIATKASTSTIHCSTPVLTFMQRQRPLRVWQQVSGERLSVWCGAFGWALMFPCCCLGGRQMGEGGRETLSRPDICWLQLDESAAPLQQLLLLLQLQLQLKRRFTLSAVPGLALTVWAAYVRLWVLVRSSKTASKDLWSPCLTNTLPESGVYVQFNQENLCPSVLV